MSEDGIPCLWMRGGTSKGAYFLARTCLPTQASATACCSPSWDRPIRARSTGSAGRTPLTSKVAILSKSSRADADVDYLFLQVFVDRALASDAQGCGNILAGVGPAAIERGLVTARDGETEVRIHMVNTGEVAVARVATPGGRVTYRGETRLPAFRANMPLCRCFFANIAGSMCGALLPTGNAVDLIDGIEATLIDNGMPCVILRASDFGISGNETRDELEAHADLKVRIEAIRLQAGPLMNLGDVTEASVPKMVLVSQPMPAGDLDAQLHPPPRPRLHRLVFAAITVATAMRLKRGLRRHLPRQTGAASITSNIPRVRWKFSLILTGRGT